MFSSTSGCASAPKSRLYPHASTPGETLAGGTPHSRILLYLWGVIRPGRYLLCGTLERLDVRWLEPYLPREPIYEEA